MKLKRYPRFPAFALAPPARILEFLGPSMNRDMQNKPKDTTVKGTIKSEAIVYFDEKVLQAKITTEKSRQSKNSVVEVLIYVFIVLNSYF